MIYQLKEMIENSTNIVFFGGAGYQPKATFQILGVLKVCTTSKVNTIDQ